MRSNPLMLTGTMTRTRRKGEVGAGAEVQAPGREGAGAKTKTERRVKRGARVAKEREAAAENDTAVAPEAKTALGDTELARAPSENVPEVGALPKRRKVPSGNQLTI